MLIGIEHSTITHNSFTCMGTVLLLIVSALLCFAVFYKAIEWFEKI